jgi:integrase/recombinase XerD
MMALQEELDRYLRLRRSLGHDLSDAARLLPRFVNFLEGIGADFVSIDAALAWAQQPEASPGTTVWPRRIMAVRGFARYLAGLDPRTQVPPVGLVPMRRRWRSPFIYSEADVLALMAECRRSIPSPFRAFTYETLFGLLAVTGLRVGETLRLDRGDLDLSDGILVIRRSKFGKSRLVPLHTSVLDVLDRYTRQRDQRRPKPASPGFFISNRGTRLLYADVWQMFRQVRDAAGVGTGVPVRPRIHDLRHSFAVRCLVEWYRDGVDVQVRLQWLSTYLGHRDPRSTYWYLSAAPELLAHAVKRLECVTLAVEP